MIKHYDILNSDDIILPRVFRKFYIDGKDYWFKVRIMSHNDVGHSTLVYFTPFEERFGVDTYGITQFFNRDYDSFGWENCE